MHSSSVQSVVVTESRAPRPLEASASTQFPQSSPLAEEDEEPPSPSPRPLPLAQRLGGRRARVGLCYDLREDYLKRGFTPEQTAEFESIETVIALERALRARGYRVERVGGARRLIQKLAAGQRWDFVFSIAEGLWGSGREAQVPAILEVYGIPCVFSDPLVLALALNKGLTKRVVRDAGVPTAAFCVLNDHADLARIDAMPLTYPVFAKPIAEGTSKGISALCKAHTPAELRHACEELWARFHQPVIVETFLPGREFTVGVIGSGERARAVGVMEVIFTEASAAEGDAYSYETKTNYAGQIRYEVARDPEAQRAAEVALSAWRALGCRDGGRVDVRSNERGEPQFLEVNPLAGLRPGYSDLVVLAELHGVSYESLLDQILDSFEGDLARRLPPFPVETQRPPRRGAR
jgi:D-alanine-D-alanine ligase